MKSKAESRWRTAWRIVHLEYRIFKLSDHLWWTGQKYTFHLHDPVVRNIGISPRTCVDIVVTCTSPSRPEIHDGPFSIRVPKGVYLDDITIPVAIELLKGVRKKSLGWLTFDRLIDVGRESHPIQSRSVGRHHPPLTDVRGQVRNRVRHYWFRGEAD